jgi:hypothetical protein
LSTISFPTFGEIEWFSNFFKIIRKSNLSLAHCLDTAWILGAIDVEGGVMGMPFDTCDCEWLRDDFILTLSIATSKARISLLARKS